MNRRDFMRLMGLSGAGLVLPGSVTHALAGEAAMPDWHLGFQNPRAEELHTPSLKLDGRLPKALTGTFYRNGPARHALGDRRYSHWFDGDGMVHAYRLGDGRISHHARFVETPKYIAETRAGAFRRPAFGTVFPDAERAASPDAINVANTNILPFDDRLLALWEGGSAWEVDPETLATGDRVTWSDDLAGAPFSAHPAVDTDGTLWNFGVVPGDGALVLYEIAPSGKLRRADVVALDASPMVHDFAITRRHLVFLLPPFRLDPERFGSGKSFVDSHRWYGDDAMQVLVIDKRTGGAGAGSICPPACTFTSVTPGRTAAASSASTTPVTTTPTSSPGPPAASCAARIFPMPVATPRWCAWIRATAGSISRS